VRRDPPKIRDAGTEIPGAFADIVLLALQGNNRWDEGMGVGIFPHGLFHFQTAHFGRMVIARRPEDFGNRGVGGAEVNANDLHQLQGQGGLNAGRGNQGKSVH